MAVLMSFLLIGAALQALVPRQVTVLSAQWGKTDVTKIVQEKIANGRLHFQVKDVFKADATADQPEVLTLTYQLEGMSRRTQTYDYASAVSIDHLLGQSGTRQRSDRSPDGQEHGKWVGCIERPSAGQQPLFTLWDFAGTRGYSSDHCPRGGGRDRPQEFAGASTFGHRNSAR